MKQVSERVVRTLSETHELQRGLRMNTTRNVT